MEKKQDLTKLLRQFGLLFVILAIVIIMSIVSPVFLKPQNIINIIRQVSINGIIAVGMTCVILTGGIDLSVGSVVAITSVICGSFLAMGINWFVACISGVAISILFGLFNGYMISYVRFQPFIATLASMAIGRGIGLFQW